MKPGWPRFAGVPGFAPTALTAAWAACGFGVSAGVPAGLGLRATPLRLRLPHTLRQPAWGRCACGGFGLDALTPSAVSGWFPSGLSAFAPMA